jgi:hypothetical protein
MEPEAAVGMKNNLLIKQGVEVCGHASHHSPHCTVKYYWRLREKTVFKLFRAFSQLE